MTLFVILKTEFSIGMNSLVKNNLIFYKINMNNLSDIWLDSKSLELGSINHQFSQTSLFVFHWENKIIRGWNDMGQSYWIAYPHKLFSCSLSNTLIMLYWKFALFLSEWPFVLYSCKLLCGCLKCLCFLQGCCVTHELLWVGHMCRLVR